MNSGGILNKPRKLFIIATHLIEGGATLGPQMMSKNFRDGTFDSASGARHCEALPAARRSTRHRAGTRKDPSLVRCRSVTACKM